MNEGITAKAFAEKLLACSSPLQKCDECSMARTCGAIQAAFELELSPCMLFRKWLAIAAALEEWK